MVGEIVRYLLPITVLAGICFFNGYQMGRRIECEIWEKRFIELERRIKAYDE